MLRKSILVLATAFAVGSAVVSTSAFAFGPLPLGGPGPISVAPPILVAALTSVAHSVAVISVAAIANASQVTMADPTTGAGADTHWATGYRGLLGLLCDHPELPHEHGLAHATGLRLRLRQQPCPLAHKMPIGGEPAPQDAVLGHARSRRGLTQLS